MSTSQPQTRWWESYLVRYFMPSIAGAGFVLGLSQATPELGKALMINTAKPADNGYGLLLIFLYGSFYCYMASLPILVFHATRVLDFKQDKWKPSPRDGYTSSIVTAFFLFIVAISRSTHGYSFAISVIFPYYVTVQLHRLYAAAKPTNRTYYVDKYPNTSSVYAYAVRIARRRASLSSTTHKDGSMKSRVREEITETYRHLREHGNSAFIYIHECILAMFIHVIFKSEIFGGIPPLLLLAATLAIWSIPAMFTHWMGQHIERRFSKYDIMEIADSEQEAASSRQIDRIKNKQTRRKAQRTTHRKRS